MFLAALGVLTTTTAAQSGGINNTPVATINSFATPTQCKMPYASIWKGTLTSTPSGALASFAAVSNGPSMLIYNTGNVDFSKAGAVAVDVTNSTASESDFNLVVHDTTGGSLSYIFAVPANTSESVALMLCPTSSPAQYGMTALPSPYQGIMCSPGYAGQSANLSAIKNILICPCGAHPATQIVFSNVRLLQPFSYTTLLTGHVDAYGQTTIFNFPGELTDPSQFATRRAAEEASFTNLLGATVDSYGGSLTLPAQTATGHFRVAKVNGKWWLIDPLGNLFFMHGIDGVDPNKPSTIVSGREWQFASLPASTDPLAQNYLDASKVWPGTSGTAYDFYTANLQRKYGANWWNNYISTLQNRCQSWGFNTLGSYSAPTVTAAANMPYIKKTDIYGTFNTVSTGSDAHGPMPDPFDPAFQAAVVAQAKSLASLNNDPNLIAIVVGNELSWSGSINTGNDPVALCRGILAQDASTSPAKSEFLRQLQYAFVTIDKLNTQWGTSFTSWAAMSPPLSYWGALSYNMQSSMGHFVTTYANKYYSILRAAFKSATPNIMFFGSSLSRSTPGVIAAEAANCDGLAFNMYGPVIWPAISNALAINDMPIVSTEWSYTSTGDGLYGAFAFGVPDQVTRGIDYVNYVQMLLTNPNFVGCNFFLYASYPTAGSVDNQQNNVEGMVDVTDTPFAAMVAAVQSVALTIYQTRWSG